MAARNGFRLWDVWYETKKLKGAIFASVLPIVLLDLLDVRLDLTSRWAPILHKFGLTGMGLILAHVTWRGVLGQYIDVSDLLERAQRPDAGLKEALVFGAAILARVIWYIGIVGWFTMGL